MIVATGFLALYWVFFGQRKYNEMFFPKRKTKLKAILFDLDGVIIDSFEAWYEIYSNLLKKHEPNLTRDKYRNKLWGISTQDITQLYFKEKAEAMKKICVDQINKNYKKIELLSGVEEVLRAIKKKKIKIGLATNNRIRLTTKVLKHYKIFDYFDAIVTRDDGLKPKPYPDPILKVCEKLKVMPDETIYVGDTKSDYKAGKSAGCLVVGLNTNGDLVIDKVSDLMDLL